MSDVSVLKNDAVKAFRSILDKIRGKHGSDPDTAKLVADGTKLLDDAEKAAKAVQGAAKDLPALIKDAGLTAEDFAKLVADALAKNLPGAIADAVTVARQVSTDVADVKQAVSDGEAAAPT